MKLKTLQAVSRRLDHAREQHPVFADNKEQAFVVIMDELNELFDAIQNESWERQVDEALDVIATCVRFIEGDIEPCEHTTTKSTLLHLNGSES